MITSSEAVSLLRGSADVALGAFTIAMVITSGWMGAVAFPRDWHTGMTELTLLLPITRSTYYVSRVIGYLVFQLGFYTIAVAGFCLALVIQAKLAFGLSASQILRRDLLVQLTFGPFQAFATFLSLAALATIASSRYGHIVYWLGLQATVLQSRMGSDIGLLLPLRKAAKAIVSELVYPFIAGPLPEFVRSAGLGDWYLWRGILQGVFGLTLALAVGTIGFGRMDLGKGG